MSISQERGRAAAARGQRGWLRAWEGLRAFDPHPSPLPAREREEDGGSSKGLTPRTLRQRRRRPLPQASQEATPRRTGVMQRSPQGRGKERRPGLWGGGLARCCAWAVTSGRALPTSSATGRGRRSRRTLVGEGRFAGVSLRGLRAAEAVIKVKRWCVRSRDFGGVVWVALNERIVRAAQESFGGRHQRAATGAML